MMVSLIGVPNVGKSTLINTFLKEDLSAVTNVEQTTRSRYHCVFREGRVEIVFNDTPGIHTHNVEINKRMNEQAVESTQGIDCLLVVFDVSRNLERQWPVLRDKISNYKGRIWVVFNKCDLFPHLKEDSLKSLFSLLKKDCPNIERYFLTFNSQKGIARLRRDLVSIAPEGAHLYPKDDISNKNMRFFASEYIREAAMTLLREELPHELAVTIEEYFDKLTTKGEPLSSISATIIVNRPGQRAIVVGRKGEMAKKIGIIARQRLEKMIGHRVFINLHVKVVPRWFKNNFILTELGLPRAKDSARVWRKM